MTQKEHEMKQNLVRTIKWSSLFACLEKCDGAKFEMKQIVNKFEPRGGIWWCEKLFKYFCCTNIIEIVHNWFCMFSVTELS